MSKFNFSFIKKINKNTILIGVAVIGIVITGGLILADKGGSFSFPNISGILGMSDDQIGKAAIEYINKNLSSTPASLVGVSKVSGILKVKIKIGETEYDSYATRDGKFLFPQGYEINPKKDDVPAPDSGSAQTAEQIIASIVKTDKPMLEAYIVARCPFGLQMQRMMADAIKTVPALAAYTKTRYIGSVSSDGKTITAMHGDAEAKENLRQICIREEQPAKYWNYISCQMKAAGTETSCEQSTGVGSSALSACISDPSRGVAYAKEDFDLAGKYGASGSPTLMLDGATISEFTSDSKPVFGGRTSDEIRAIVCAASNTQPGFCSAKLNTAEAATSFSVTYASAGATSADASCAPAQ